MTTETKPVIEPPPRITNYARAVGAWFAERNIRGWELLDLRDRWHPSIYAAIARPRETKAETIARLLPGWEFKQVGDAVLLKSPGGRWTGPEHQVDTYLNVTIRRLVSAILSPEGETK